MARDYTEGLNAIVRTVLGVSVTPYKEVGVVLARKGGSGRKAQRTAYGRLGAQRLAFHWIISSLGDTTFAIHCTQAVHDCTQAVVETFLRADNIRAMFFSKDLPGLSGLVTQLFALMNVGAMEVVAEAQRNGNLIGARAVVAL